MGRVRDNEKAYISSRNLLMSNDADANEDANTDVTTNDLVPMSNSAQSKPMVAGKENLKKVAVCKGSMLGAAVLLVLEASGNSDSINIVHNLDTSFDDSNSKTLG